MTGPGLTGRKKNERIRQVVQALESLKAQFGVSYAVALREAGIGYRRFLRWRRRLLRGEPPVKRRGPKKLQPLDLRQLRQDIAGLHHGGRRTAATRGLAQAYRESLSRRQLGELVRQARQEQRQRTRAVQCRVVWHRPDLVWSLDGCTFSHRPGGVGVHVQNLQDLCSRYKFPPLATGWEPDGEALAGHLAHQFARFGPPLFCKRDNAGNLNHRAVDQLLAEQGIIPLNSPVYRAPYNGAIEHSQGEIKRYLTLWRDRARTNEELYLLAESAAQALNHYRRRSLSNQTACQAYFGGQPLRYTQRQRHRIFERIRELAIRISEGLGKTVIDAAAWRIAAKDWMVKNRLITILKPREVSPNLEPLLCHQ